MVLVPRGGSSLVHHAGGHLAAVFGVGLEAPEADTARERHECQEQADPK